MTDFHWPEPGRGDDDARRVSTREGYGVSPVRRAQSEGGCAAPGRAAGDYASGRQCPDSVRRPAAIEAADRALADPATHRYVADAGLLTLREALCEAFDVNARSGLDAG